MNEELNTELDQLIRAKPFEDLNSKEREFALSLISMDEYMLFRKFLCEVSSLAQEELKNIELNTTVKNNLTLAFKEKYATNKSTKWIVPVVITLGIAACSLLMFNVYDGNDLDKFTVKEDLVGSYDTSLGNISDEEFVEFTKYENLVSEMQIDKVTKDLMVMDFSKFKSTPY